LRSDAYLNLDFKTTLLIVFSVCIITYVVGISLSHYFYRNKAGLEKCEGDIFDQDFDISKYIPNFRRKYFGLRFSRAFFNGLFIISAAGSFFKIVNKEANFDDLILMIMFIAAYTALNTLYFTRYKNKTLKEIVKRKQSDRHTYYKRY
ncbi:MAG: hypothetical protein ACRCTA_00745, partial [Bacilli bacterium]